MLKRLFKFGAAAIAAVIIAVGGGWTTYHAVVGADPLIVELFGGAEVVDLIRNADRVEAFRIEGNSSAKSRSNNPERIGGYEVLSGPVMVDEEGQEELANLLTSAWTYWWIVGKGCEIRPGVAF